MLCLAARTELDEAARTRLRDRVAAGLAWDRLQRLAFRHEVTPLVAETLARDARDLVAAEWLAAARRRTVTTVLRNEELLAQLTRVLDALEDGGVDATPVKGLVLGVTLYGGIARRPAGDLDVLVRPADLPRAREILRSLGFGQRPTPTFDERVHPFHDPVWYRPVPGSRGGAGSVPDGSAGTREVALELHWALWSPRFFDLSPDVAWDGRERVILGGRERSILGPEATLLHLAIHRSRSALRLRWLCDIAELVRHRRDLDWQRVETLASAGGARTSTWLALALANDLLGAEPPRSVLEALRPNRLKRRVLDRTAGVDALFRTARDDDLRQQPHLVYRVLEQDGARRVARSLVDSVVRTSRKRLDAAGIVRPTRV